MHRPDRRHHLLPWELLQVPVALPQQGPALEDLEKARWYLCRVIDYGEKIAWTRQQYDILTALVAHTVGVEARTWAKLKQGYPDSALALIDELIKRERDKQ